MKCANNPILTLLIPQRIQIQDNSSRHLKYHVGRPNRGQWSQKTPYKLLGLDWKVPAYVPECHWHFGANSLDACFLWWRSSGYNCWFVLNYGTGSLSQSVCHKRKPVPTCSPSCHGHMDPRKVSVSTGTSLAAHRQLGQQDDYHAAICMLRSRHVEHRLKSVFWETKTLYWLRPLVEV